MNQNVRLSTILAEGINTQNYTVLQALGLTMSLTSIQMMERNIIHRTPFAATMMRNIQFVENHPTMNDEVKEAFRCLERYAINYYGLWIILVTSYIGVWPDYMENYNPQMYETNSIEYGTCDTSY